MLTSQQKWNVNLHVLEHYVLVGYKAVNAVVSSLPPVVRRTVVQQQRGALLKRELAVVTP